MEKKLFKKMLLVGLMLNATATVYPAVTPEALPENLRVIKLMFVPGGTGTKNDFERLPQGIQTEIFADLLDRNDDDVQKAFYHAVVYNLVWAIQPLLDQGAKIYGQNGKTNNNILSKVYYGLYKHGHTEIAEMLIARIRNSKAIIPFEFLRRNLVDAASTGHTAMVELLINKIATLNLPPHQASEATRSFGNALSFALQHGHTTVIKLLLEHPGVTLSKDDNWEENALIIAARKGHAETLNLLLGLGAKIDYITSKGDKTALMLAARGGHIEIVKKLINTRAELDLGDNENMTALMLAAREGHIEIVETMINARAKLDVWNNENMSALMLATRGNHALIIKAMIDAKAQIDTSKIHRIEARLLRGLFGRSRSATALAVALQHGHVETAQELLNEHRKELAQLSCRAPQNLEKKIQEIDSNFEAVRHSNATVNDDDKSDFEQLPNTWLQSMAEFLPLPALENLRRSSRTCRAISQFQFKIHLKTQLKTKFQQEQEEKCSEFMEKEIDRADLPNRSVLAMEPFDYWQVASTAAQSAENLDADIAGPPPAPAPGCAIA